MEPRASDTPKDSDSDPPEPKEDRRSQPSTELGGKKPQPVLKTGGDRITSAKANRSRSKMRSSHHKRGRHQKRVSSSDSSTSTGSSSSSTSSISDSSSDSKKKKHRKGKKVTSKKRNKKRKRYSSSPPSSSEDEKSREDRKRKRKSIHFDPAPIKTKSWSLPKSMAKYVSKNSREFISDKNLIETIMDENPVPSNIPAIPTLDDYLSAMLEEKRKYFEITRERSLTRIQNKVRNILGPLSRVWEAITSFSTSDNPDTVFDAAEVRSALDKTVVLVGQAQCAVSYQRRLSVLEGLTSVSKAKSLLKKNTDILQMDNNNLFGDKFEENLEKSSKISKKSIDYFGQPPREQQPFRQGPPLHTKGEGARIKWSTIHKSWKQKQWTWQLQQAKVPIH